MVRYVSKRCFRKLTDLGKILVQEGGDKVKKKSKKELEKMTIHDL
ncbi:MULTISPECIES: hypothetical protein [Clostridium]|nr:MULTISPECIES: hypothetical protein [Clostridium]KOR24963.1 hypothetical protein ND00_24100 [Clostridium sp. L74]